MVWGEVQQEVWGQVRQIFSVIKLTKVQKSGSVCVLCVRAVVDVVVGTVS